MRKIKIEKSKGLKTMWGSSKAGGRSVNYLNSRRKKGGSSLHIAKHEDDSKI